MEEQRWPTLSAEERADDKATFISGEPGFGRSACEYFAERKIILTGGDTSANDAQPVGEIDGEAVPCHTELQTRHGIWNIENLDFEPLLADGVRVPVRVGAAQDRRRHRLAGQPGSPVLNRRTLPQTLEPACGPAPLLLGRLRLLRQLAGPTDVVEPFEQLGSPHPGVHA